MTIPPSIVDPNHILMTGENPFVRLAPEDSDDYTTTLTSADQAELAAFLDAGGRLFITGQESEETRRRLIRNSLIDSSLSMVVAFVVVITLAYRGEMSVAMLVMLLSMGFPFLRIWLHRREIVDHPGST